MNSLTPVTSISQSLQQLWLEYKKNPQSANEDIVASTISGLDVIGERGDSLIRFVNSYRLLSKLPTLNPTKTKISVLFDRLNILTSPLRDEYSSTQLQFNYPNPDFAITIDEPMMVQLIINLIKNSFEAIQNKANGKISIDCFEKKTGSFVLQVTDNGPGIPEVLTDEVFVPFFSTKTDGSGVGLSFSRQLVRAHGGTIKFNSQNGKTVFIVEI